MGILNKEKGYCKKSGNGWVDMKPAKLDSVRNRLSLFKVDLPILVMMPPLLYLVHRCSIKRAGPQISIQVALSWGTSIKEEAIRS